MMKYEKKGQIKGFLQNMNEREWKTAAAEPHTSLPASHLHSSPKLPALAAWQLLM